MWIITPFWTKKKRQYYPHFIGEIQKIKCCATNQTEVFRRAPEPRSGTLTTWQFPSARHLTFIPVVQGFVLAQNPFQHLSPMEVEEIRASEGDPIQLLITMFSPYWGWDKAPEHCWGSWECERKGKRKHHIAQATEISSTQQRKIL